MFNHTVLAAMSVSLQYNPKASDDRCSRTRKLKFSRVSQIIQIVSVPIIKHKMLTYWNTNKESQIVHEPNSNSVLVLGIPENH